MSLEDLLRQIKRRLFPAPPDKDPFPNDAWTEDGYQEWFEEQRITFSELESQRRTSFAKSFKFSIIVPLYKTPLDYLGTMVGSVLDQSYANFELVLVNASPEDDALSIALRGYADSDSRIRVISLEENMGIAKNTRAGIDASEGDFVCLLDHDDLLEPDALFEYASCLEKDPCIDMLYCDEDLIEEREDGTFLHQHPFFKPDYSPEALLCTNYILHFLSIRRSLFGVDAFADALVDGTQDYHAILSVIRRTNRVHHVSRVLYHWRMSEESTAANPDAKPYDRIAARRSIGSFISLEYPDAQVIGSGIVNTQNLWFRPTKDKPVVSIVVDATDPDGDVRAFLELFSQTNSYHHVEVILIADEDRLDDDLLQREGVKSVSAPNGAPCSSRFNAGAEASCGNFLLFITTGSMFQTPEPIEQMLGFCKRDGIGVVAPKTLYSDGSVRCYGVAVTSERIMPLYRGYPDEFPGYQCNLRSFQNNSAASYLGLMTPRALFVELGGFDERFEGEIGAADYCRRVLNSGDRVVQTCTVKLQSNEHCPELHYDNKTNAPEFTEADLALFDQKWPGLRQKGDPYFNRNLDQSSEYFQIQRPCKER